MSVPAGARGENLSTVFTEAIDFLAEIIRTANCEKHFRNKMYKELAMPLMDSARSVARDLYRAMLSRDSESRRRHAGAAMLSMHDVKMELHLNYLHFNLKAAKASSLVSRLDKILAMTKKWLEAVC